MCVFAIFRWQLSVVVVNTLVLINEINRLQARLVPGWVTIGRWVLMSGYVSTVSSHPGQLSLAIPPDASTNKS